MSDWLIRRWITRSRFISNRISFRTLLLCREGGNPSIHLELLLISFKRERTGGEGRNIFKKEEQGQRRFVLWLDAHTLCEGRSLVAYMGGESKTCITVSYSNKLLSCSLSIVQGCTYLLGGTRERINHEEMKPFASSSSSLLVVQMDGPAAAAAATQRVLDFTYEIYIQDLRLTDSIQLLPPTSIIHLMLLLLLLWCYTHSCCCCCCCPALFLLFHSNPLMQSSYRLRCSNRKRKKKRKSRI